MTRFKKAAKTHWVIILILLLSLLLRLWRLDSLVTFGGDQGYDYQRVKEILEGNLTLLGPKIGPYNDISTLYTGPFYYYLLAPFLFLSRLDPVGASVAYVLSRLSTTFLIYIVTLKIFSKKAAIISAAISAVSPYWLNALGPPSQPYFIIPLFLLLILIVVYFSNKRFTNTVCGFLIGLLFQLHYLSALAIIAFVLLMIKKDVKLTVIKILSTMFGFIIGISPMIVFEIKHNFFLTTQIIKQVNNLQPLNLSATSMLGKINHLTGAINQYIFPKDLTLIVSLFLFLILAITIYKSTPKKYLKTVNLLFLTLVLNVVFLIFYPFNVENHYFMFALASAFVFAGPAIYGTKSFNARAPFIITAALIVNLLITNDLLRQSGYTMPEDLTTSEIRQMSKKIQGDIKSETFNIASTLDGDSRAGPYRYMVSVYGKTAESVENYDKPDNLYIITRDPARVIRDNKTFEIASFQPSHIENVWEIKNNIRLIKLSKEPTHINKANFVVLVNPVRSRQRWNYPSVDQIKGQIQTVSDLNLQATWLLQYDNLYDQEVIDLFKKSPENFEIGAFLEVGEKLATDARVSYLVGEGDYYRPDKVFLSGYKPQDRKKIIDTYFKKFRKVFGKDPEVTGAWYIDASTLFYLSQKGIIANVILSDQYNTDAASIWGQYFSYPYYPSKYNSLEPAATQQNKIPIVQIQWAQRDSVLGYGPDIKDSRQSFQANDYLNNGFDSSYFDRLLKTYLENEKTDFVQITVGLEAGQEGSTFLSEYEKQLKKLKSLQEEDKLQILTLGGFANWYKNKYIGTTPSHFLEKGDSFWYMNQFFRVGIVKDDGKLMLRDLRYFKNTPNRADYFADKRQFLERRTNALVDQVTKGNQIVLETEGKLNIEENFDRLAIFTDNIKMIIDQNGAMINENQLVDNRKIFSGNIKFTLSTSVLRFKDFLSTLLSIFKYSRIESMNIIGVQISGNRIIGIGNSGLQYKSYDFQTLAKFKSPASLIDKWQPWAN